MAFQKTLNRRLLKASQNGDTEDVQILLEAGANVHAEDNFALFCASANGHTEIVKLLLEAGANVHAVHHQALRWASHRGHTEIVELLRKRLFLGRQATVAGKVHEMKKLAKKGWSKSAIARQLNVGRTSVRRWLAKI